jgi:hypothetical protein
MVRSRSGSWSGGGADIRLRLAGVKPNSDATRIMISACLLATLPKGSTKEFAILPVLKGTIEE